MWFSAGRSKKVLVNRTIKKGDLVKITGAFTSAVRNGHKKSYITAKKIEFLETDDKFEDVNIICLRGFMCDKPYYREKQKSKKGEKTKRGISTFCLAVPRKVKKMMKLTTYNALLGKLMRPWLKI